MRPTHAAAGEAGGSAARSLSKPARRRKKIHLSQAILVLFLVVFLLTNYYQLFLLAIKSFKTPTQERYHPFSLTFPLNFENYRLAWLYVKDFILNTVLLAACNVVFTLTVASIAAFAFAKFRFKGKEVLFMGFLSLMMLPGVLSLSTSYLLVQSMGLIETRWAVILPGMAGNLPFNIFLLRTFMNSVPNDLFEAAKLDGAGNFMQFRKIAIPLSAPIMATAAMWLFMQSWNDIIWPNLVLAESQRTIATGLVPFTNEYYKMVGSYSAPMAGYVITSLPLILVFFLTSKQYIKGMTSGALKL